MATQAQIEGRYLGGRPPYGYLLIDAGPHPNPAKAVDGKRLHALAIDERAATVVVRIFAEFLAGAGIYAIAEGLARDGIPCPSAHDPGRNRHRCGIAWSKGAVRAILTDPRRVRAPSPARHHRPDDRWPASHRRRSRRRSGRGQDRER
jgi:hypothetical protein